MGRDYLEELELVRQIDKIDIVGHDLIVRLLEGFDKINKQELEEFLKSQNT
jgi:RNase P protein component